MLDLRSFQTLAGSAERKTPAKTVDIVYKICVASVAIVTASQFCGRDVKRWYDSTLSFPITIG
jgi:hypothetical protein